MQHYAAPTPKRHYGYSNSDRVLLLDKGKLRKHQRTPKSNRLKTADVYWDRNGVKRYKGNANLRPTQNLVEKAAVLFMFKVAQYLYRKYVQFNIRVACHPYPPKHTVPIDSQRWGPRIYPMPFARRVVDLLEEMKSTRKGAPVAPAAVPDARDVFAQWPSSISEDWEYSALADVYTYLRGNRNLKIPPTWRGIIPDRLA